MQGKRPNFKKTAALKQRRLYGSSDVRISIVLWLDLEVSLRVVAYGANLGSLLTYADVSAVAALPDAVALA